MKDRDYCKECSSEDHHCVKPTFCYVLHYYVCIYVLFMYYVSLKLKMSPVVDVHRGGQCIFKGRDE